MPHILTVTGPIAADHLGMCLPHEHVLVDFSGEDIPGVARFEVAEALDIIMPHLRRACAAGVTALFECTPAYLGRNVSLLRSLTERTGLRLVTNTGYYGAAGDKFLPRCIYDLTPERLADKWTREWEWGIDGTNIRPGFIKVGVDPGALSEIDGWLVRAAARTHRNTGLTIASHTTDCTSLEAQLKILDQEQVPPERFVWVHAHTVDDVEAHRAAAKRGIWVEFDGLSEDSLEKHVAYVLHMKDTGCLDRVLVSHDAGWYRVGEPGGGSFQGFDVLTEKFLPALKQVGFTDAELRIITTINPARAFGVDRLPPSMTI